jgi:hypothetical protein
VADSVSARPKQIKESIRIKRYSRCAVGLCPQNGIEVAMADSVSARPKTGWYKQKINITV